MKPCGLACAGCRRWAVTWWTVAAPLAVERKPEFSRRPEKEEVLQRMAALPWSRYPGGRPWLLIGALAAQMGVAPEQVVVSEAQPTRSKAVMAATLRPGDTVVIPAPTFLLYRQNAAARGGDRRGGAECGGQLACPASRLTLATAAQETAGAPRRHHAHPTTRPAPFMPRPRSGAWRSRSGLLVVDEAYAEFCDQDLTGLLDLGNVILLRTFSSSMPWPACAWAMRWPRPRWPRSCRRW